MALTPSQGTRIHQAGPLLIGAPNLKLFDLAGPARDPLEGNRLAISATSEPGGLEPRLPFLPPLWRCPPPSSTRTGTPIRLAPFSERHLDAFISWIMDDEYRQYHSEAPLTHPELAARLAEGYYLPAPEKGTFIIESADGAPLGWVNYRKEGGVGFDAYELGILLGRSEDRGRGTGPVAMSTLIDHLFSTYKTERIQARVLEHNARSLRLCEKVGLLPEGRLRSVFHLGDRVLDSFMFSITKSEWSSRKQEAGRRVSLEFTPPKTMAPLDPSLARLTPFTANHVDAYLLWAASAEYRRYYPEEPPSRQALLERLGYGYYEASGDRGTFIVESTNGFAPIGWVSYTRDRGYEAYDLSLYLPGDAALSQDMDAVAFASLVGYLFKNYPIRRIQTRVLEGNHRALHLCQTMGLRHEARLLKAFPSGSRVLDAHIFSALQDEWVAHA